MIPWDRDPPSGLKLDNLKQSGAKVVSSSWNHFQASVTVIRGQVRPRARTASQDRYLTLSSRRHRQTATTDFPRELDASSGTRFSNQTVYKFLPFHARRPAVYLHSGHIAQESPFVVESNTPLLDTPRMGACSFHWWIRFSSKCDSQRVFIWSEHGYGYHPLNAR